MKITVMRIHQDTLDKMRVYKIHPRESDNDCLLRILSKLEN